MARLAEALLLAPAASESWFHSGRNSIRGLAMFQAKLRSIPAGISRLGFKGLNIRAGDGTNRTSVVGTYDLWPENLTCFPEA